MSLHKVISKVGNTLALGVLPLAVIATVPQKAKAATLLPANINSLYVFGDSLSDTGNVFTATGGTFPPPSFYYQGRFSNGLNWVDKLSTKLGLDLTPAWKIATGQATPTAGINFAFGGSTTGTDNTIISQLGGLQQQVGLFNNLITNNVITPTQAANPNALYVLWAGANDYLPTDSSFVPKQNTNNTLTNLSNAAQSLADAGAKNLMVVDLPDLGKLPLTRELPQAQANALSDLTALHNSQLFQTIQNRVGDRVNIIPFNVSSLFNQAITNPTEFNFTNVTEPCFNRNASPPSICTNPNKYFFWDQAHPTTAVHGLIADAAFKTLEAESEPLASVPEPSTSLGMVVAILGGALMKRKVMKRKVKKSRSVKISA